MNHDHPALPRQPHTSCATFARLAPLLDSGELDPGQEAWARDHLATCETCRRQYAGYDIITAALRRHYGGMRSLVALPTAEELMRTENTDVTTAPTDSPTTLIRGSRSPRKRTRLPLATALTAATVLAVIGTLFALRGHSQPRTPGSSHTPQATQTTHGTIVEIPLSGKLTSPSAIAVGKDGALWFLDPTTNTVGRRSPSGQVSEFRVPTANSGLTGIAIASDGSVWFTETKANRIGRLIPSGTVTTSTSSGTVTQLKGGTITEFKNSTDAGLPSAITAGADGVMWYTTLSGKTGVGNSIVGNCIVPIHANGTFGIILASPYPDPSLVGITRAPDGYLWVVEAKSNRIEHFDPALIATDSRHSGKLFALPHPASDPVAIAAAPDSSAWFVERGANAIGHMSPDGKVTEYPAPIPNSGLTSITVAADGSAWFTEAKVNRIGHITPSGAITEIAVPTASAGLDGITVGLDGRIWFTETASGKLGYVTP